jgi:uncharacterized membrane protein
VPQGAAALGPSGMVSPDFSAGNALIAGMGDPMAQTNAALAQNRARLAPMEQDVRQAGQRVQQAASSVPPEPKQAAPEPQQGMGLQAAGDWVMMATAIGAIAGAMTRRSTTNALAAFTGALEGVQQGNKQAFEQNRVIWEQENKRINQQLQQQRDRYLDILNSTKTDFNTKMLLYEQKARRGHDEVGAQLAAQKNIIEIAKRDDALERTRLQGVQAYLKMDEALKVAEIRAGGGTGAISDEAVQRAKQQLESGVPEAQVLRGMSRADVGRIRNAVSQSGEDTALKKQEYQGDTAGARSVGVRLANLEAVNRNITALVPQALSASKAVGRVGVMSVDEAIQWAQTQANNTPLKFFVMTNIQLAEQWARAQKGPGVLDKGLQDLAFRNLTTAQDNGSYATAVNAIVQGVGREQKALEQQRRHQPMELPEVPGAYTPPGLPGGGKANGGLPAGWSIEEIK